MAERDRAPFLSERDAGDAASSVGTGAIAIIRCPAGLVLHLRDDDPRISNPGTWSLFGGASDSGESARQTIARELEEELGITPEVGPALARMVDREGDRRLLWLFEVETTLFPEQMTLLEGQAVDAFDIESALGLDLAPLARRVLGASRLGAGTAKDPGARDDV